MIYSPAMDALDLWLAGLLLISALFWAAVYRRLAQIDKAVLYLDSTTPLPPVLASPPKVSILVPARNEERDLGATLKALRCQDYPNAEILVVDDESFDRTAEEAAAALRGHVSAKIIPGRPRPEGERWIGKTWALDQAARVATGEYLLFSDADVTHHPAALRLALGELQTLHVDALSIIPSIESRSRWEKLIMPLFALLAGLMEALDKANDSASRACRLSGAFILIRREAYEAVGGHAAVREEILEDMALARRLKEAGRPLRLVYTHDLSRTRMYDRLRDAWQGLSRFAYPMLKHSPVLLAIAGLAAFIAAWVPWLCFAAALARAVSSPPAGLLAAAGLALALAPISGLQECYCMVNVRRRWALALPLSSLLLWSAALWSAWCHYSGRGVTWKNRRYALKGRGKPV